VRSLVFLLILITLPTLAAAEPVTYRFTGAVTRISGASVAPWFSLGDPFTFEVTVERTAHVVGGNKATAAQYQLYATPFSGTIGKYAIEPALGFVLQVGTGQVDYDLLGARHDPCDYFRFFNLPPTQSIGPGVPNHFWLELYDDDATVFDVAEPPRIMPDPGEFELRHFLITYDPLAPPREFVEVTLDAWTTPVRPESWGRIKATYLR